VVENNTSDVGIVVPERRYATVYELICITPGELKFDGDVVVLLG
jgi:hypothetical protein